MVKQLVIQENQFQFIPHTNYTLSDMSCYIADIYEIALFTEMEYEEGNLEILQHLPTKLSIIQTAYQGFDEMRYYYALNGNNEYDLREIQEALKEGLTEEDIIERWMEFRDYNTSRFAHYFPDYIDELESMFIQDINLALNMFHMCYIKDAFQNPYITPSELEIKEIANPPIQQVW